ncbi:potassium channel family protein [Sphingomonas caeni]|uniref:potassium channel family protein n=1 Tax=Sphingomonas caeni TaxID=2984949 RepID=UPI0022315248|nr:potassium channel family protein [Sphingomonas caeni]
MTLLLQLAIATAIVIGTVALHLLGLAMLLRLLRHHRTHAPERGALAHELTGIVGAAFGLFILHAFEIWSYAALYLGIGVLRTLEEALYFSTSTYATIGYGDIVLPPDWRVLGAIEGINGVILLGWSTAFFVAVVGRLRLLEIEAQGG